MRTFELLVVRGRPHGDVVSQIAEEFDTTETAVETDIGRLESWVGDLPPRTLPTGELRMQEFRQARQRLYELIPKARRNGDADLERRLVRDILDSIATDIELCQSLGLAVEAPGEIVLPEDVDADDPVTDLAERDPAVLSTSS